MPKMAFALSANVKSPAMPKFPDVRNTVESTATEVALTEIPDPSPTERVPTDFPKPFPAVIAA